MNQADAACPLMQIIDILGNEQQFTGPFAVKLCQRMVCRIGRNLCQCRAPLVIEVVHQRLTTYQSLRRADVLDALPLPQTTRPAKGGNATFSRDPCPRQDNESIDSRLHDLPSLFNSSERSFYCDYPGLR